MALNKALLKSLFPPIEFAFFGNYINRYKRKVIQKVSLSCHWRLLAHFGQKLCRDNPLLIWFWQSRILKNFMRKTCGGTRLTILISRGPRTDEPSILSSITALESTSTSSRLRATKCLSWDRMIWPPRPWRFDTVWLTLMICCATWSIGRPSWLARLCSGRMRF